MKSDDELRQLILNRRARFVAAAMCTSGVVFSACSNGNSDPIGTVAETPTGVTSTSVSAGSTPCLTTALPPTTATPPTACLGAPYPGPCLTIAVPPPSGTPSDTITITTAPPDTEPRVCLSPPYPTVEPSTTLGGGSTLELADAGSDAAPGTEVDVTNDVANATSANAIPGESAEPTALDASVEPSSNP